MLKVVTSAEMRKIEEAAGGLGESVATLMHRAGRSVAAEAENRLRGGSVLVLAGPGNNGGDGVVAARTLLERGLDVTLYTFRRDVAADFSGTTFSAEEDGTFEGLDQLLRSATVVVDALLGAGRFRPVMSPLSNIIERCNGAHPRPFVVAVDVPTGVDADTGAVPGASIVADVTLVMAFLKPGNVVYPGAGRCGRNRIVDIGIPVHLAKEIKLAVPEDSDIAHLLPTRDQGSNKGSNGRVLVVSGSRDFLGAPALCASAAYRAGAGLVEVVAIPEVQRSVSTHCLEAIFTVVPDRDGRYPADAAGSIVDGLSRAKSLVLGPGMGLSNETIGLVRSVLPRVGESNLLGTVVDADGLNAIASLDSWSAKHLILTPHPGEMSRLTGLSIEQIQAHRVGHARRYAHDRGVVLILKGAGTVVAHPDGTAVVNPTGGPNLATGGTGDVLSGIIGGLLAQGCDPFKAAVAGVYLHGRAGDLLRREHGDAGTLAGDLLGAIPTARLSILEALPSSP